MLQEVQPVFRHALFPHKPKGLFPGNDQIRTDNGDKGHIAAPYIQHPRHFVQGGKQDGIAAFGIQLPTKPGELLLAGPAGIDGIQQHYRTMRGGWPILPDGVYPFRGVDDVEVFSLLAAPVQEGFPDGIDRSKALQLTIHRYDDVAIGFCKVFPEPLGDAHHIQHRPFVHFHAGSGQLLVGLDKVTAVGPKTGMVLCDDHFAFTGKSRKPGNQTLGDDNGIPAVCAHEVADCVDSVSEKHIR